MLQAFCKDCLELGCLCLFPSSGCWGAWGGPLTHYAPWVTLCPPPHWLPPPHPQHQSPSASPHGHRKGIKTTKFRIPTHESLVRALLSSIEVYCHCLSLPGLPDPHYAKDMQLSHCTIICLLHLPIPCIPHYQAYVYVCRFDDCLRWL